MHCCQLIIRKISKFDVTRCQILRLECAKFELLHRISASCLATPHACPRLVAVVDVTLRDGIKTRITILPLNGIFLDLIDLTVISDLYNSIFKVRFSRCDPGEQAKYQGRKSGGSKKIKS